MYLSFHTGRLHLLFEIVANPLSNVCILRRNRKTYILMFVLTQYSHNVKDFTNLSALEAPIKLTRAIKWNYYSLKEQDEMCHSAAYKTSVKLPHNLHSSQQWHGHSFSEAFRSFCKFSLTLQRPLVDFPSLTFI